MSKSMEKMIDKMSKNDKKVKKFGDLLDNLKTTTDKKKMLWKEVYENAIVDRENASILFNDLLIKSKNNSGNHQVFGPIMSKYLERMSKSNDQILRLAEIIAKENDSVPVSMDDIFNHKS